MKKIATLLLLALFVQCQHETTTVVDATAIKPQINKVIDTWHLAATNADFDAYFGALDSISVFIGTDAFENWDKKQFEAFSKPYFDNGKAWDFKVLTRNTYISSQGDVVWFDELLDTWMGACRGSGVLEKKDDTWKIKHYVLSMTIPNDDVLKVLDITKEKDSIARAFFKKPKSTE